MRHQSDRQALARMLDANANRAREGLRALEDIARFALDNASLQTALKSIRHELTRSLSDSRVSRQELLLARDVEHDVGTAAPQMGTRTGLRTLAAAAASRTTEALRTIEECFKALGESGSANRTEQARYGVYAIERALVLDLAQARFIQPRLCVLITERLCLHAPWQRVAESAIEGGADCIQLREKGLNDSELLRRAKLLVALARDTQVFINDRVDIALASGAAGVHLGQHDVPLEEAHALLDGRTSIHGDKLFVGISTENIHQARNAVERGADLCGVGPMFATATKPKESIAGPAYLREFLCEPITSGTPCLAIGGITPENVGQLAAVGCPGIAVSSAVCGSPQPRGICELLVKGLLPR